MTATKSFASETVLPDKALSAREETLLGFETRLARVHSQLRLLLQADELAAWNRRHHRGRLAVAGLVAEQYPFVIFHGDVGTGKTAMAECMANRIVSEARVEDSVLFRLSNRVRGSGLVGEMGTQLADAFHAVTGSIGKNRRAILIIDEGDSLGASRSQQHSHHEDKVGVNTLIQAVDDLRGHRGRIVVFLCTNRLSALDPALVRRAAVVERFERPSATERRELLAMDLGELGLTSEQLERLVQATGAQDGRPDWTYSDIRTRLYPRAVAKAFPGSGLAFSHLAQAVVEMQASPTMEDR